MQAIFNFTRKSTDGFSIGNILLDFTGGVANYAQMAVQSIDQGLYLILNQIKVAICFYPSFLIFINLCNCPFSRFLGELLWKYREDTAVFGMDSYLHSELFNFFAIITKLHQIYVQSFLILFYIVSNWTSSGDTCLYIDGFYYFRYLYSLTFFSWDNISCCILPRDSLLNSAKRALNHLSSLLMTQYLKPYESFGCSIDICID
jgi:hypothetical protein